MSRAAGLALAACSALFLALGGQACSHTDALDFGPADAAPSSFTPDGSVLDATPVDSGLVAYCPALACTSPWATCPGSQFPCDVNILTDPNNCGSCGFECPSAFDLGADFFCSSGTCKLKCAQGQLDCNGILDDGCEARLGTNQNCNACGDKCLDPAKPCIYDSVSAKGTCGCAAGQTLCDGYCVNTDSDDQNCTTCGHVCDTAGPALPPHEHYGCSGAACGSAKCDSGYADCNKVKADGCEANLSDEKTCGACAVACLPGQVCRPDSFGVSRCICAPGQTLCGESTCTDIKTDPSNCGACGFSCSYSVFESHSAATCKYGTCVSQCEEGWGDCNGDPGDGCETHLYSDQNNCGACGVTCDVFGGQPCIAGQCAIEPCNKDGGITR